MNLTQLKYFNAVCTYRKVSDAAKHLHISQPSLSNAIKDMENEFGVRLFQRQHSGMELTREGKTLLKLSTHILNSVEQAQHIMCNLGNERKNLRLGVPPMIGALVMPNIYSGFSSQNPHIMLEITESGREELIHKLSDDFLDMVLMPHTEALDADFCQKHIGRLELVCCISHNNPLSQKKSITPSDLKDIPLVLFKDSFFQTEQIKKWFSRFFVNPHILMQTQQLSTVQSLISHKMAVGFMFKELVNPESKFKAVPLCDAMYVDVSLVWKKNGFMFDSMQKFIEHADNSLFGN